MRKNSDSQLLWQGLFFEVNAAPGCFSGEKYFFVCLGLYSEVVTVYNPLF
jgi:hypothetical protein